MPLLDCFFSKSKIFFKFAIFAIFEVVVTRCFQVARKIFVTFAPLILWDFRGPFWPFLFLSLEYLINWLFLQLLLYLQVIVSQNFLVNHFFGKNCEKNLLANFCSQDRSWTYLNSYETLLIPLELFNCLTFFNKDARSF